MASPVFITTPNGNVVSGGSGGNPVLDLIRATVTWNGVVEQFASPYFAQIYYDQVVTAMVAVNAGTPSTFIQNLTTTPVIFTINPTTYSVLNDGTFIQVIGTGFTPILATYVLTSDDNGGGGALNTAGYIMTLTYINPNLMTAVYQGPGDGVLPAGAVAIYISTGVGNAPLSNVLNATSQGNKEVTVDPS